MASRVGGKAGMSVPDAVPGSEGQPPSQPQRVQTTAPIAITTRVEFFKGLSWVDACHGAQAVVTLLSLIPQRGRDAQPGDGERGPSFIPRAPPGTERAWRRQGLKCSPPDTSGDTRQGWGAKAGSGGEGRRARR